MEEKVLFACQAQRLSVVPADTDLMVKAFLHGNFPIFDRFRTPGWNCYSIEISFCMCSFLLSFYRVRDFLRWTTWVNTALEMPMSVSTEKTVLHPTSAFLMYAILIFLICMFRNILNTSKNIEQNPLKFLFIQASGWLKTFSGQFIWKDIPGFLAGTCSKDFWALVWLHQSVKHNVVKKKDVYAGFYGVIKWGLKR